MIGHAGEQKYTMSSPLLANNLQWGRWSLSKKLKRASNMAVDNCACNNGWWTWATSGGLSYMIIGYARVSSGEQKMDLQLRALSSAGCKRIYKDHGQSGQDFKRDGLTEALQIVKAGDTLVVWRLDRLGRSLQGLIEVINELCSNHVHFRSLMENIDTASSGGRLMFHMMGALAEFERNLISERTQAGLDEARIRGKQLGRPNSMNDGQIREAVHALCHEKRAMETVADDLGISVRTLRRHLQKSSLPKERLMRPHTAQTEAR